MSLLISQSEPPSAQTSVIPSDSKIYLEKLPFASSQQAARDNSPQPTMIQRTLLRQSRALNSSLKSAPRASLSRPQFLSSQPSLASLSRSRPFISSRWYSTEPEAKNTGEAAPAAPEAVDPVKKELEEKNKEILDLKVCATHPLQHYLENHELTIHKRTNTSAPLPSSETSRNALSVICKPPKISLFKNSPKISSIAWITSTEH